MGRLPPWAARSAADTQSPTRYQHQMTAARKIQYQPASDGRDASSSPTTPSNGSSACHNASKASDPHPRLGPSGVSADAIQRPFTSSSRTSTQNAEHWRRYCCTSPSCTSPPCTTPCCGSSVRSNNVDSDSLMHVAGADRIWSGARRPRGGVTTIIRCQAHIIPFIRSQTRSVPGAGLRLPFRGSRGVSGFTPLGSRSRTTPSWRSRSPVSGIQRRSSFRSQRLNSFSTAPSGKSDYALRAGSMSPVDPPQHDGNDDHDGSDHGSAQEQLGRHGSRHSQGPCRGLPAQTLEVHRERLECVLVGRPGSQSLLDAA